MRVVTSAPAVALVLELAAGSVVEATVLWFSPRVVEVAGSAGDVVRGELDVELVAATEPGAVVE